MKKLLSSLSLLFSTQLLALEVAPSHWWKDMTLSTIQVMFHAPNIANMQVDSNCQCIEQVIQGDSANYLFVYVDTNKATNQIDFKFSGNNKILNYAFDLKQRKQGSPLRPGFSPKDVLYLLTPDRFANGDPSNDTINGYADKYNRQDPYGRHGGDIKGLLNNLDYFKNLGITQLWTMPMFENNMPEASYHGYAITNHYLIDPRFGSNDEFKTFVQAAKSQGIGFIQDVILNHIGVNHPWMKDMPTRDWINHGDQFVQTTHRREALHDPHGVPEDISAFADGWFVPSMPDLNQRNKLVADFLIQNSIWWVEEMDLSGIRVDTYPYSDKTFLSKWTHALMNEYPNFNIVGEEWSTNPAITAYWQKGSPRHDAYQSDLPSVMDFPLQTTLDNAINNEETWATGTRQLYELLASDFLYGDPYNLVIFADNHDMDRVFTRMQENIQKLRMQMRLVMTLRGIPQIFYGTEWLLSHPGTSSHGALRMDFPGGWADDQASAFTGQGLSDEQNAWFNEMRRLLQWRKLSKAVTQGKFTQYSPDNGIYVYFRHHDDELVMVVMNKNDHTIDINEQRFQRFLANKRSAEDVITGVKTSISKLSVPAMSVQIFSIK